MEVLRAKLMARMEQHGPMSYASRHEAYGLLAEEFNKELLDALHSNSAWEFEEELLDVAVGCVFELASAIVRRNHDKKEAEDLNDILTW